VNKRVFDLSALDGIDRAKLLIGLVVPRPIGWIGTTGPAGDNLAPYSFFNLVVTTPPILLFCPGRSQRDKDTLVNVLDTGEFSVNIVTETVLEAMNATSLEAPPDVDEFLLAGLAKADGDVIDAPLVADAVAAFECTVTDVHHVGEGPAASVVYGEVLRVHVDEAVLDGTRIRFDELGAIGRLAGPWYSRTRDLIELERPDG
jgi:flavin reductase (DIM6/NTAB) family NADH-FMN oxidoreductase RutF